MTDGHESDEDGPRIRKVWRPSSSIGLRVPTEDDISLADRVAVLPEHERREVLGGLDMGDLLYDVDFWARPSQLAAINSDKWLTIAVSGRGWGKTWFLARAIHKKAMENPGCRMALVGRSTSDVRDILILGDSGVLSVVNPSERPAYKPAVRRLVWPNGSEAMTFTADIPDQLRGVQFHYSFGDELGSWRVKTTGSGMANAWSQLQIATRLGDKPQIFIATTPRRVPMIIDAIKMAEDHPEKVLLVRGSTYANRHLGGTYKDAVTGLYAGTNLGAQELEGELLSDVEGALLTQECIDENRRDMLPSDFWLTLPRRIVGVDPTVSSSPGDECGIVVVGATGERKLWNRRGYVIEDASLMGSPSVWAAQVVRMARKYHCPVVAEDNQGGEMVRMVIKDADPNVQVTLVRSKAGKHARAEPVAMAYQQGRVHHLDWFSELEDQLTAWAPDQGMKSPDRLDAVVHGLSSLLVNPPKDWIGSVRSSAFGATQHLSSVRNFHPSRLALPIGLSAGSGSAQEVALRRLEKLDKFNVDDLRPRMTDEEIEQENRLKRIGRSSRMRIGQPRKSDPYGAPVLRPKT